MMEYNNDKKAKDYEHEKKLLINNFNQKNNLNNEY